MANFTTVATFSGPLEAHIARGRLEAEGIPVFIANEQHIWADMLLSPALGGIRIQVLEENAEKAREILSQQRDGDYELDNDHEEAPYTQ